MSVANMMRQSPVKKPQRPPVSAGTSPAQYMKKRPGFTSHRSE